MEQSEFRIGEVATRAEVSVDTVRYYERLKLLPRARRSSGGFRLFDETAVDRVLFIKQAQELGFTLDEIKELSATGGAEECRKVHDLLGEKLQELDSRLESMKTFRRLLARHFSECERELLEHGQEACCPVIALGKREPPAGKMRRNTAHEHRTLRR
jgi:DNA-binding transcriptional MerR regulator